MCNVPSFVPSNPEELPSPESIDAVNKCPPNMLADARRAVLQRLDELHLASAAVVIAIAETGDEKMEIEMAHIVLSIVALSRRFGK